MFSMEIATRNAAFFPDAAPELARLLRELAERLDGGDVVLEREPIPRYVDVTGTMMDINGNTVATWKWKPDD